MRLSLVGIGIVCAWGLLAACSGKGDGSSNGGGGAGGGGAATASGAGGAASGAGGAAAGTGSGGAAASTGKGGSAGGISTGAGGSSGGSRVAECSGLPLVRASDAATCGGVSLEAEAVGVDMYIMMDRSVSMAELVGTTGKIRWDFVHEAVQKFVLDPGAANIGVGIQFFGQSGSRDDAMDCDVSRYSTPAVPIGPASQVGAAVVAAVDATLPGGLTPTYPALQGAVAYGKQWASTHPGRATVVVLVTDGFPTQCQNPVSVSEIAAVAKQAAQVTPPVRTYVVGLAAGTLAPFNLDSIASSGGTQKALLVNEGDITQSFVTTLLNISNDKLACEYTIPTSNDPNLPLDPNKVQVVYTPAVGAPEEIPRAQSLADCATSSAGGWYYDSPTSPSKILVCPCTCSRFAAGKVDIRLGCAPQQIR
jgi:hypothetical protein